jgi:hypothetical protein
VRVTIRGMTSTVRPQGLGSFIAVRRGLVDKRGAIVSTKVGSRTVHRRLIP